MQKVVPIILIAIPILCMYIMASARPKLPVYPKGVIIPREQKQKDIKISLRNYKWKVIGPAITIILWVAAMIYVMTLKMKY